MNGGGAVGVIVGSGVGRTGIEDRLRSLEADGHILWLGHVHDQALLTQLWAHCAVYVHGHSVGGTNPSLLQALGAGAPTIALDTPFNAEVIRNEAQLYGASPEILTAKIERILQSPDLAVELGRRGQLEVAERYAWSDVCQAYLNVLERLGHAGRSQRSLT
jgi:glycosyltransferase involved in cell wall biosynthesis